MKRILSLLIIGMLSVVGALGAEPAYAEVKFEGGFTLKPECEKSILGLRPWYAGLVGSTSGAECVVGTPKQKSLSLFVWTIVLNVLADLFIVAGYLAIGFVVYGGILYIMSAGDSGKVAKGKQVLTSAVIGLIITILATVIVNIIIRVLTGATS